ncbi:unnamed protein product [marine sediment metagenome]|uniref:Uncharacterized protein n=1 Tax=marine sediment metagenome TaxID=412755 RepID=X1SAJ4_9ZZZZ
MRKASEKGKRQVSRLPSYPTANRTDKRSRVRVNNAYAQRVLCVQREGEGDAVDGGRGAEGGP